MKRRVYVDPYVIETLMPDLVRHDKRPSAYLLYLHLWAQTGGSAAARVSVSLQRLAEDTGLSKRAVQHALAALTRRRLVRIERTTRTAVPAYGVLHPWRRGR